MIAMETQRIFADTKINDYQKEIVKYICGKADGKLQHEIATQFGVTDNTVRKSVMEIRRRSLEAAHVILTIARVRDGVENNTEDHCKEVLDYFYNFLDGVMTRNEIFIWLNMSTYEFQNKENWD